MGRDGQTSSGLCASRLWRTPTFLAALRHDGITAPCVFDGPISGDSFPRYVEQFLLPTLKPGGIAVMDNPRSHKGEAVRAAIKSAGAIRLPDSIAMAETAAKPGADAILVGSPPYSVSTEQENALNAPACGVASEITRHFTAEEEPARLPPPPLSTIGANIYLRWKEWMAGKE